MSRGFINYIYLKYKIKIFSFEELTKGYVNDVYHITTDRGYLILKIYNILDNKKIDLSISVQDFMSQRGLSPKVLIKDFYEKIFIIQEYVPNSHKLFATWKNYGQNLGIIHKYLKQFGNLNSNIEKFIFEPKNFLSVPTNLSDAQLELLSLKKEMFLIFKPPILDKIQLIHGDYTWNNVLYNNHKIYTIDFDQVKNYYAIYDIAKVIFNILFTDNQDNDIWVNINDFIAGYQSINKISYEEKRELFNIYGYTLSHDMSGILDDINKNQNYLKKRIDSHKKLLVCYHKENEVMKMIKW